MFLRSTLRTAPSLRCCRLQMPLRAKINWPAGTRAMATAAPEKIDSIEGDNPDDVIFASKYGLRSIALNRPKALNALDGSMARKIVPRLQEWSKSQLANVVVIKSSHERSFCAGGDVKALAKLNLLGEVGQRKSCEYFALEYKLDHLIATYSKPYVAFIDGITMGGGVGLSVHAPFRIATEKTLFAMPETDIGFFPDVGGSFFLSRMEGEIGTYLALTSERLEGVNTLYSGIATHYIHSSTLPDLEERLSELQFPDYASYKERLELVNDAISEFTSGLPDDPFVLSGDVRRTIDRCFKHNTMEQIVDALKADGGEFALKTLETMLKRSPTSLRVTLRQLREGRSWTIAETFQREYFMATKFMQGHDFTEGVVAKLIDKREPKYKPATLEEVSPEAVNAYFDLRSQPVSQRLQLLNKNDYKDYPYYFGLPTEEEVKRIVVQGGRSTTDIIRYFQEERNSREGIKTKVLDVLQRKTEVGDDGVLRWVDKE